MNMRSRADYMSLEFCEDACSWADHMFPKFYEVVTYMVLGIDGILCEIDEILVELTVYKWGYAWVESN
ncbi:hypothetical protein ACE6H2_023076 [Prunus campanulata]